MPMIFPAPDQKLPHLLRELAAVGGVRDQNVHLANGGTKWGYQVTDEVYRAWQESLGVQHDTADVPPHDPPPPPTPAAEQSPEVQAVLDEQAAKQPPKTETPADGAADDGDKKPARQRAKK